MEQVILDLLSQYGYLAIFIFLVLGIVGLPLPDEIMMTFIGYLSSIGHLSLYGTFLSALAGSVGGISISYFLGQKLGYPFLKRYGSKIFITQPRLHKSQLMFRKYGKWVLFFGYFIPGVRHITAYMAGISNMAWSQFILYAFMGAITWCSTFIGLGYLFGSHWHRLFEITHQYGALLAFILIPIVLALLIRYLLLHQKRCNSIRK
ncbi:DedA family protein [Kroppenstedtia pulmonis]|uniref:DedA family protein n=1 Tax=Kroppenstedtia pulmonis TaxID=1380685 RepID=A0A7D4CWC9_9BACL|nr:DedA family protein [Kroppenstedtia pulmonis]QKG84917.1 DedA family protein [Kroppenstedtia pulmonis]